MQPPPYPRIPYLWPPPGGLPAKADRVLAQAERVGWLRQSVTVEEKLDGANVSLWLQDGQVRVASRGGPDAMDRGHQLGRLRAWVGRYDGELRELLHGGRVLYAEWLWVQHGTAYVALPDWLVALDLWTPSDGFLSVGLRDELARGAGLPSPPRRFEGVLASEARLWSLLGISNWGQEPAEGLILRARDGRRCKVIDPRHVHHGDGEWDPDRHNALAASERVGHHP